MSSQTYTVHVEYLLRSCISTVSNKKTLSVCWENKCLLSHDYCKNKKLSKLAPVMVAKHPMSFS